MSKLIIFIDWFYPGYKSGGPATSNLNMVRAMSQSNEFIVVTRDSDYTEPDKPYPEVTADSINDYGSYKACYLSSGNTKYKTIRSLIKNHGDYTLYINGIYSLRFSIFPLIAGKRNKQAKIIVAPRGMLSRQALEVKSVKKKIFLGLLKFLNYYKGVVFHCTNEKEAEDVRVALGKKSKVFVAGNFTKPVSDIPKKYKTKSGGLNLIYIGRISEEKNLHYLLKVFESITEISIHLDIYGSVYNSEYWDTCRKQIMNLPQNITVAYNGDLKPSEIPEVLSEAGFFVSPTTGENFGHSIIESLGSGTPSIISNRTPWHNTVQDSGLWEIPLENMEDWRKVITNISTIPQLEYDKLSKAVRDYAIRNTDNIALINVYNKLFE